jgi:hypothetical protein
MLDLDGTVLGPDGSISSGTAASILRARNFGWEVVIATGRTASESADLLAAIGHQGITIFAGGGLACDTASGSTIHRRTLDQAIVEQVSEWLIEHGHRTLVLKDHGAAGFDYLAVGSSPYHAASKWWFAQRPIAVMEVDTIGEDPCPSDSIRVGAVADACVLDDFEAVLRDDLGDRARILHWSAVTGSHAVNAPVCLLEVLHPSADKWTMMAHLREEIGVVSAGGPVVAIGDGLNDIEMLAHADIGIAMGHASDAVIRHANWVTGDYQSQGFATAIDAVLDGKMERLVPVQRACG